MICEYTENDISLVDYVPNKKIAIPLNEDAFVYSPEIGSCFVKYIDIFLSSHGSVKGKITIDIYYNTNKHKKYTIEPDNCTLSTPLRLDVSEQIELNFSAIISVDKNIDNVFIWTDGKNPCIDIVGNSYTYKKFSREIIFSIVMPTYNTNIDLLKLTIASVINQSYPKWELCIVDDGSKDSNLIEYLRSIQDSRVKINFNKKNKGIVGSSNDALKLCTGEYIAFLDHDDLLDKHALLEVASVIEDFPNTDLIYTDEDKVFDNGTFGGTFYKSDWNYNLMLSSMYTCHLSVYKKSIVDEIKGFRKGFDGSQDYDFALRFIEIATEIRHIPKVLYHWRITHESTAMSIMNKPEARINATRAISDHLKRVGVNAVVAAGPHQGHYDVRYKIDKEPHVTIIIPFKDKVNLLINLLDTMKMTDYNNYSILLVNNNSKEKNTYKFLESIKQDNIAIIDYSDEFNFSKINNFAVVKNPFSCSHVLFLNNDIEIMHPEWLNRMVQQFTRPSVSAVGAKLLYLDHRIQHAGIFVGINGIAGHSHKFIWDWEPGYFSRPHLAQDITAVTGACMLVNKYDFLNVGGFEESLPKAFNDVDFCLKLRKIGRTIIYTPYARLYHRESASRGIDESNDPEFLRAIGYMLSKWNITQYKDPYYNINLPSNCEGNTWQ